MNTEDKRPEPKPRKHPRLWQAYLFWDEVMEMRKRHTLRISSIERGKSNLDAQLEKDFIADANLDLLINHAKKIMTTEGAFLGEIWEWVTSIRGLGEGGLAAQLLAQIDDISRFDTVSKLWRFAGQAVIEGKAERFTTSFNRRLKSVCFLVSDQFIKQQTPLYVDLYYSEKDRLRSMYPEPIDNPDYKSGTVGWPQLYTDMHVHRMAMRKTRKIFLQHLWVNWRTFENLPTNGPYVQDILGHTHIVVPE